MKYLKNKDQLWLLVITGILSTAVFISFIIFQNYQEKIFWQECQKIQSAEEFERFLELSQELQEKGEAKLAFEIFKECSKVYRLEKDSQKTREILKDLSK